ncbi:unnamed protein product [Urochloa decumbens]|uniref:F-box domain-containing protein n=1 Tax=Urochloa decumbens TaxID=240449 RepID=A0ABC8Z7G7_9POAL
MAARDSGGWDFLDWLGPDTSACIFHRLDDPADLARAAAVSRSWRQFVIVNGFCKRLCLRICPDLACFTRAAEVTKSPPSPAVHASGASHDAETDHRIYSNLSGTLVSPKPSANCIRDCICASSTDRFPAERMQNTLDPREVVGIRPSYWSSKGQDDPDVPESLTYRLCSDLCIVDEIRIRPYQVSFYDHQPIFSSKMVRFRIGSNGDGNHQRVIADGNYTSPEFPMLQENVLQSFKLPRPVLCIGGVVTIELLGRMQKAIDDMYYICICHTEVIGRSLLPSFTVDISDGATILMYLPGEKDTGCDQ